MARKNTGIMQIVHAFRTRNMKLTNYTKLKREGDLFRQDLNGRGGGRLTVRGFRIECGVKPRIPRLEFTSRYCDTEHVGTNRNT
jgi:hypothetical protein